MTINLISTTTEFSTMLSTSKDLPETPPSLYIDLEGAKLSRFGTISLLTIYVRPTNTVYMVDIHNLGTTAFTTPASKAEARQVSTSESTVKLKSILESPIIPKVFFDVRNDSDALFAHYGIAIQAIHDLQLMELATTTRPQTYVNGLARCIQRDANLTFTQVQRAKLVKQQGAKLFAPEKGGSYDVFNERPLQAMVQEYCVQDVVHIPKLWAAYYPRMSWFWRVMVKEAGEARVRESQNQCYGPNGEEKKYGCFTEGVVMAAQKKWNGGQRLGLM